MTRLMLAILFVISGFLFTALEYLLTGNFQTFSPIGFIHICLITLLVIWWLRLDAVAGHPSSQSMRIFAIIFPPLALPVHFFRSRGAKDGLVATLALIALLVLFTLSGECATQIFQT